MKNLIKVNKKRIDAFKVKAEVTGSKIKMMYGKEVKVLDQRNHDVKKNLAGYRNDGQSKWEEFRSNFTNQIDGISKSVKNLFKY